MASDSGFAGLSKRDLEAMIEDKEDKSKRTALTAKRHKENAKSALVTVGVGYLGAGAAGVMSGLGMDDAVKVGPLGTSQLIGLGLSGLAVYKAVTGDQKYTNALSAAALGMTAPTVYQFAKEAAEKRKAASDKEEETED